MCERGAFTPDVSCTAEHQSTIIASHQSTRGEHVRTGSGLEPIFSGSGLNRTEKIFVVLM